MSDIQFTPAYIVTDLSPVQNQPKLKQRIKNNLTKIGILLSEQTSHFSDYVTNSASNLKTSNKIPFNMNKFKNYFKKSYILPIVLVLVGIFAVYFIGNTIRNTTSSVLSDTDQRISIKKPKAQQVINKEFLFPLKDDKGKEVSKVKYFIQDVQLQDEIVVKGQRATAVKGRTFLVIYLKITNDFTQDISLKTRDYVRLMVNNNSEKLAPDVHNDPVDIQAISTKYTRLGFPINDSDTNLILQVGEINGNKQNIKLDKLKK